MGPAQYFRGWFLNIRFSLMFICCLLQKDWSTEFTKTWMFILGMCICIFTECPFWRRYQQCFHGVDLSSLRQAAMKEYFRQPIVDTFDMRVCMSKSVRHIVDFQEAEESDLHRIGKWVIWAFFILQTVPYMYNRKVVCLQISLNRNFYTDPFSHRLRYVTC
jgi:hypothetical protein